MWLNLKAESDCDALSAAIEMLGLNQAFDTDELNIRIPKNLYFFAARPKDGYGHILDNQEIVITGWSGGRKRSLTIVLSQDRRHIEDSILNALRKGAARILCQDRVLYLGYVTARELVLDLIRYLEPCSVNIVTKGV